jgi:hypothetical protein
MIYVGFDFSCNKTACCILKNNKFSFYFWPLELDDNSLKKLSDADVIIDNRTRLAKGENSSEKFRYHISMANDLSNKITNTLKNVIGEEKVNIGFEGSSFGSKGDAGLQLAGYRYILVRQLSNIYGLENIYTYAPLTIKSVAGCAGKDKRGKNSMIETFAKLSIKHNLNRLLKTDQASLKKKTNFVPGVDDLVDAYFVLKTLREKERV